MPRPRSAPAFEARPNIAKTLSCILGLAVSLHSVGIASAESNVHASLASAAASRAIAVSGPVISVTPLSLEFGVVNIGEQSSRPYTIQNVGDQDLEIGAIGISDSQVTTNASLPMVIPAGGSSSVTATYRPTGGGLLASLQFLSNASNGAFRINASGRGNTAPHLDVIGNRSAAAFAELRFTVVASDLDLDPVLLSADPLPNGAAFDPETGVFAWTPGQTDGGAHVITFGATDGFAGDAQTITITVSVSNHPPVFEVPGNMTAVALGTADRTLIATDPDGDPLSFFKVAGPSYATVITTSPGHGYAAGTIHLEPGILDSPLATIVAGVSDGALSDQASISASLVGGAAGGNFGEAKDFVTEGGLSTVGIGDLNGDGQLDLAKTNFASNSVSVRIGNGDGTFGGPTAYGTGSTPGQVAVGDLNGDGWLDLAVVNLGSSSVSVLLGGGGGFGDKTDYGAGADSRSLVIGDLNGDARLDLVTSNFGSSTVSVLLGRGDGTFEAKTDFPVGINPGSLALGDLNGDGRLDIAALFPGSSEVGILLGHGDGSFGATTTYLTGSHPIAVAIGDLNGDSRLDLAVANVSSGTVSVFLGNGNGTFSGKTDYSAGCESGSVAVGDLDGDGRLDLAVMAGCSSTVSTLTGNGDGTFGAKTDYSAGGSFVTIRDLDGDRRLDLVVSGSTTVSVLLNREPDREKQSCGPKKPHRVLVDSSRDGGVWWSPQGESFVPCFGHQGLGIADYLRSAGLEVDELPRPFVVTRQLLEPFDFVIRFTGFGTYSASEIDAYREFVSNGGRLILVAHYQRPGQSDALAAAFGISFRGIIGGGQTMTRFTPHPITQDLSSVPYSTGSGIFGMPSGATTLGWLSDDSYVDLNFNSVQDPGEPSGVPAMGVMRLGSGEVFFVGSAFSFLGVPQPFLANVVRYFFVRPVALDVAPSTINVRSHARSITAFIEPTEFGAAEIDPSSIRLNGVAPLGGKAATIADHDGDGIPDLELKFDRGALLPLLSVGNQALRLTGAVLTGGGLEGLDSVRVIDPSGGHAGGLVAPNPLNPVGVLTFDMTRPGPVSIQVFDLQGRLVRRLIEAQPFAIGSHEVLIDGRADGGQHLPSGVYFYRVERPEGDVKGRFAVVK